MIQERVNMVKLNHNDIFPIHCTWNDNNHWLQIHFCLQWRARKLCLGETHFLIHVSAPKPRLPITHCPLHAQRHGFVFHSLILTLGHSPNGHVLQWWPSIWKIPLLFSGVQWCWKSPCISQNPRTLERNRNLELRVYHAKGWGFNTHYFGKLSANFYSSIPVDSLERSPRLVVLRSRYRMHRAVKCLRHKNNLCATSYRCPSPATHLCQGSIVHHGAPSAVLTI